MKLISIVLTAVTLFGAAATGMARDRRVEFINNPTVNLGGQSYLFDANSDPNGICRALGFGGYVQNTMGYQLDDASFVTVDARGRIISMAGDSIGEVVTSIGCTGGRDDQTGSRLFNFPTYNMDGITFHFHPSSERDAVCRYLGFRRAVAGTIDYDVKENVNVMTVRMNGRIENLDQNVFQSFVISQIMCRR